MRALLMICIFMINLYATGILGKKAPSFGVNTWIQTNTKKNLDIEDFKGKVVYLYGFQSWCPGCHSHGFPTLNILSNHYKDDKDVAFIAIQTAFEGFFTNTVDSAKKIIKKYNLTMPVGHSGSKDKPSQMMINYKTGGTPWTIIIDKKGIVRFNNFHLESDELIRIIDRLKKEK